MSNILLEVPRAPLFDPNQEWISIGENGLNDLQSIGTTEVESERRNPMYIARTLFGNSKSIFVRSWFSTFDISPVPISFMKVVILAYCPVEST